MARVKAIFILLLDIPHDSEIFDEQDRWMSKTAGEHIADIIA